MYYALAYLIITGVYAHINLRQLTLVQSLAVAIFWPLIWLHLLEYFVLRMVRIEVTYSKAIMMTMEQVTEMYKKLKEENVTDAEEFLKRIKPDNSADSDR